MKFQKATVLLTCILVASTGLTGCACKHETWNEADCTTPKTCADCGITEGEALGHDWKDATCEDPKTCSRCGETEGEALGHTYDTTNICTESKTCEVCGKEIPAAGHKWVGATCTEPQTCSVCGATEGEALGHDYVSGACSRCGEEQNVLIYDDSYVSVYYRGIEFGNEDSSAPGSVKIFLYAENKTDQDIGIQMIDPSIDGSMIFMGGSMNLAAGKNSKEEYHFYLTEEFGEFYSADEVEFKLTIFNSDDYHTIIDTDPITIDINNNTAA